MGIIGISGKVQSGKDLAGSMTQFLLSQAHRDYQRSYEEWLMMEPQYRTTYEIHKFADPLKEIVCTMMGCKRSDLEDINFKNSLLPECWRENSHLPTDCTYRLFLQMLGSDIFNKYVHPNTWINSLMGRYDSSIKTVRGSFKHIPNWIITDVRFPNEVVAIENRGGIVIRLERDSCPKLDHISETALDEFSFKHIIYNNGSKADLLGNLNDILATVKNC